MSVKFTRRSTFAATITAVYAMSAGTMASAADMKVGANVGNVPWEFQNEKGEIVGFEIDLSHLSVGGTCATCAAARKV